MEKLTHWKNLTNSEYLGAYSFAGKVDEVVLTIKNVEMKKVVGENGKEDNCPVAEFVEREKNGVEIKPMVLNRTNCNTIEDLYKTPFIEHWVGKKVTVYVKEDVKVGRVYVPALRIKKEVPIFKCSVCGKEIDEKVYAGSVAKYGKAYCSKECLEKNIPTQVEAKQEQVADNAQETIQEN